MAQTTSVSRSPDTADRPRGRRPFEPIAERVLIIGLDGATFDVLDPMMAEGWMPALREFIRRGTAGVLQSTKPPMTPAAWTTFMTGKGPGRHGIIDFESYDVSTHTLSFNSTWEIREKTIWEHLSQQGLRVGSIHVPMTYPPRPVHGFMISGFETPSIDAQFTWPPELRDEILRLIPDYDYRTNWRRSTLGGLRQLQRNLDYIARSFEQGWQLTEYCGEKYGWDALMVVFKLVDNLQHKTWKYLDPRYSHRFPRQRELVARCFSRLDQTLEKLFEYAARRGATVLIMSDHGHGSLDGKAQPNLLLKEWGYLALRSFGQQALHRAYRWWERLRKGHATRFEQGSRAIERDLPIDWSRTQACVMHAGVYGFLYINLKGRGPLGIVEPQRYESLRDEIAERLRSVRVRDPQGREIPVFEAVYRTEELYRCSRDDNPDLPDLLLAPHPGLAVVRKIRGQKAVRWCSLRRLEGTHRAEGIFAIGGPHVRAGGRVEADIMDLTPTVLASLGLRVPADMEGRVLTEVFEKPPVVEHEPPIRKVHTKSEEEIFSEQERKVLEKRLADLGYLE